MKFTKSVVSALATLGLVSAAPVEKRAFTVTDTLILQYALTLEHLEYTFYSEALMAMSDSDFAAAGFAPWVRNRFLQVCADEESHVAFLTGALGSDAVAACNYTFPYNDPQSFAALAAVIENVGISAYLGAASLIKTPGYVTAAGAILSVENQHQTWISAAVEKANPWSSPYATPLGFNGVYSLVAPFFAKCPSSNPALPFTAYPTLTLAPGSQAGQTAQLNYTDNTMTQKYLIVYYGLSVVAAPINADQSVMIPSDIQGTAYGVVSSSNNVTVVDPSSIIAGPVVIQYPFMSEAAYPTTPTAGQ